MICICHCHLKAKGNDKSYGNGFSNWSSKALKKIASQASFGFDAYTDANLVVVLQQIRFDQNTQRKILCLDSTRSVCRTENYCFPGEKLAKLRKAYKEHSDIIIIALIRSGGKQKTLFWLQHIQSILISLWWHHCIPFNRSPDIWFWRILTPPVILKCL